jgi:hypothetical protein
LELLRSLNFLIHTRLHYLRLCNPSFAPSFIVTSVIGVCITPAHLPCYPNPALVSRALRAASALAQTGGGWRQISELLAKALVVLTVHATIEDVSTLKGTTIRD